MRNSRMNSFDVVAFKRRFNRFMPMPHSRIAGIEASSRRNDKLRSEGQSGLMVSRECGLVECSTSFDPNVGGIPLHCDEESVCSGALNDHDGGDDLSMLQSLRKSSWKEDEMILCKSPLREHEYDDESGDDSTIQDGRRFTQSSVLSPSLKAEGALETATLGRKTRIVEVQLKQATSEFPSANERSLEREVEKASGVMRLVFDRDFDCYFDPVTGQYYKVMPKNESVP
ncbi:unnamed protein product [Toxocara canis]|uniref:Cyclin-dependent kinases regulatory subunit n=1 Tax=Toxocara canis TaxID=6265 RepID=A0A183TUZ6_TOXCA|nr:unnamed protein product [Toxocara canis]